MLNVAALDWLVRRNAISRDLSMVAPGPTKEAWLLESIGFWPENAVLTASCLCIEVFAADSALLLMVLPTFPTLNYNHLVYFLYLPYN